MYIFTNYLEAVKCDVIDWIEESIDLSDFSDRDGLEEYLNDTLWAEDNVTGNASGSYTCNRELAKSYVESDTETVTEALREFCVSAEEIADKFLNLEYEYFDVTARCYVLGCAIAEALEELNIVFD